MKKSEEVLGYCYIHGELNEQGMTNAHDFWNVEKTEDKTKTSIPKVDLSPYPPCLHHHPANK